MSRTESGVPFWLIAAITALLSVYLLVDWNRSPNQLRSSQGGTSTAESLVAHIRAHQRCPATLEEIGIDSRPLHGAPLLYRSWDDRTKCAFTSGDYGLRGFEEYWSYPPGDWYYYQGE